MATLKTKFSVGLFLIAGITLIIVGVVWLGMSKYLERGRMWVAYFDESVQGLDRDSAVKYRGVNVGRVHSMGIAPDGNLIEVVMQIDADLDFDDLKDELSAQLKSVGITGLMFIELDRILDGDGLTYPPPGIDPPYPVVPTHPSEITKFFKGIDDVFATLRALDTQSISDELVQAIRKLNRAVEGAQLDTLVADIHDTVKNLRRLVQPEKVARLMDSFEQTSDGLNRMAANADAGIDEIRDAVARLERFIATSGDDIEQVTADLKASAQQISRAMDNAAALMENSDQTVAALQRQALQTLQRIDQAGDTLNRFLDRIAADPSQLLFSGSPVEKPAAP